MSVSRLLPSDEAEQIVAMARDFAAAELAPRAARDEADTRLPRDAFRMLGELGLLGMPYPDELGGGGQAYEVYLQVLEELAARWVTIAVGLSVHVVACHALATRGTAEQQAKWLPAMLGGQLLGGYCLSEPQAGWLDRRDPRLCRARAESEGALREPVARARRPEKLGGGHDIG